MKKRKLIPKKILATIVFYRSLKVPLSVTIRELDLNISRPALVKLIKHYHNLEDEPRIHASMFPEWLDPDSSDVQEQPDDFLYLGYFPTGEWVVANGDN